MAFLSYFIACFSCSFGSFASSFFNTRGKKKSLFFFLHPRRRSLSVFDAAHSLFYEHDEKNYENPFISCRVRSFTNISHERNSKRMSEKHTAFSSYTLYLFICRPTCCAVSWLNKHLIRIWLNYHQITSQKIYLFGTELYDLILHKKNEQIHSYRTQRYQICEAFLFVVD